MLHRMVMPVIARLHRIVVPTIPRLRVRCLFRNRHESLGRLTLLSPSTTARPIPGGQAATTLYSNPLLEPWLGRGFLLDRSTYVGIVNT